MTRAPSSDRSPTAPAPSSPAVLSEIERHELQKLERHAAETARTNPWLPRIGPVLGR